MRSLLRALPWGCLSIAVGLGTLASAEAQQPLRIGGSFSSTGIYTLLGQTVHRGHQLCVKHTNDKGGVLGRRIELVVEDDQSQAATAAHIYEKLITQDKVDVILEPYSSLIDGQASNREPSLELLKAVGEIVWKVAARCNGGRA